MPQIGNEMGLTPVFPQRLCIKWLTSLNIPIPKGFCKLRFPQMGVPFCRPRTGGISGQGRPEIQKEKQNIRFRRPAWRDSKIEKFSHTFLILRAPIFSSKRNGKFFCFGTEILQKFQGGSGAEAKPNFQKKFELRGITAQKRKPAKWVFLFCR
jgi:hypothetical protein